MSPGRFATIEGGRPSGRLRQLGPAALAIGIQTVASVAVLGPAGLAIAATTACGWALLAAPYGLAAGHVALVALGPSAPDPLSLAAVEVGFLAVLVASLASGPSARRALAAAALVLLATGGVAWLARSLEPGWSAGLAGLGALAILGYGSYRYQRVRDELAAREDGVHATTTPEQTDHDP